MIARKSSFFAGAGLPFDAAWSRAAQGAVFLIYQLFAAAIGFCLGVIVGGPVLNVLVSASVRDRRGGADRPGLVRRLVVEAGAYLVVLVVVTVLFWLLFRILAIGYAVGFLWGMYRMFGHLQEEGEERPSVYAQIEKVCTEWSRRVAGRKRQRVSSKEDGRAPIGRYGARQLSREDRQKLDELLAKWRQQVDRLHTLADAAEDEEQAEKLREKAARIEEMMQEL